MECLLKIDDSVGVIIAEKNLGCYCIFKQILTLLNI